jgi:SAM-dependent methyltransferase
MSEPEKKKIEARFDRESRQWRDLYARPDRRRFSYNNKLYRKQYVLDLLGSGSGAVLDLGCGAGEFLQDLRRAGFSVVGADFSAEMVRLAAETGGTECRVVRADATATPFRSGAFRALIAVGLVEYLPEDGAPLAEIARIVGPGGAVVVTLRNARCLERRLWKAYTRRGWMKRETTGFYREHTVREFQAAVVRAGFTNFEYRFCHFYPLPWPLSKALDRFNQLLAHLWERVFSRSRMDWLGSTIICRFEAPSGNG